ncbi:MAG: hypothetical protein KJ025_20330 [Burkholderiales bacterium]|nr:hypothetical protein [Burkholderiales bacterium]
MPEQRRTDIDDVAMIREIVANQFRSLAWTRDQDPDWEGFARGFAPEARLFPAARPVRPQTVDQFVDRMKGLRAEGRLASFQEFPLGCVVRAFGNVAVAFAACEMLENGSTVTRDLSAIVLVRDAGHWRIVAQAWDVETESNRIPADLAASATC